MIDTRELYENLTKNHIIAPNEGNTVALACGYHISTGRVGLVYMQNSGLGNAINPIASLYSNNSWEAFPVVDTKIKQWCI